MKVLKFGGSSVAGADSFAKVIELITKAIEKDVCIVVLSAVQGMTDALIEIGRDAEKGNDQFREKIKSIENKHFEIVRELIPISQQSAILSFLKKRLNELDNLCEGVFMLRELTMRSLDRIVSFGEILSSSVLSAKLNSLFQDASRSYALSAQDFSLFPLKSV